MKHQSGEDLIAIGECSDIASPVISQGLDPLSGIKGKGLPGMFDEGDGLIVVRDAIDKGSAIDHGGSFREV
jgi:hypothetical protein